MKANRLQTFKFLNTFHIRDSFYPLYWSQTMVLGVLKYGNPVKGGISERPKWPVNVFSASGTNCKRHLPQQRRPRSLTVETWKPEHG